MPVRITDFSNAANYHQPSVDIVDTEGHGVLNGKPIAAKVAECRVQSVECRVQNAVTAFICFHLLSPFTGGYRSIENRIRWNSAAWAGGNHGHAASLHHSLQARSTDFHR